MGAVVDIAGGNLAGDAEHAVFGDGPGLRLAGDDRRVVGALD